MNDHGSFAGGGNASRLHVTPVTYSTFELWNTASHGGTIDQAATSTSRESCLNGRAAPGTHAGCSDSCDEKSSGCI
jgi:hypothetical protein